MSARSSSYSLVEAIFNFLFVQIAEKKKLSREKSLKAFVEGIIHQPYNKAVSSVCSFFLPSLPIDADEETKLGQEKLELVVLSESLDK